MCNPSLIGEAYIYDFLVTSKIFVLSKLNRLNFFLRVSSPLAESIFYHFSIGKYTIICRVFRTFSGEILSLSLSLSLYLSFRRKALSLYLYIYACYILENILVIFGKNFVSIKIHLWLLIFCFLVIIWTSLFNLLSFLSIETRQNKFYLTNMYALHV